MMLMPALVASVGMVHDLIEDINSVEDKLWTAGPNERFDNTPLSELKSLCGVKAAPDYSCLPVADSRTATTDLPESFDSETNWPQCAKVIGDIRDQSMCGCCWAFAGASAASDRLCISTNGSIAVPLSAYDVCFCAQDDGCNGGQID